MVIMVKSFSKDFQNKIFTTSNKTNNYEKLQNYPRSYCPDDCAYN
jgi:hypothetical protein